MRNVGAFLGFFGDEHMTVHVIGMVPSVVDVVLGTAKAFGRALRVCAMVDQRRAGMTASSKGTLSAK